MVGEHPMNDPSGQISQLKPRIADAGRSIAPPLEYLESSNSRSSFEVVLLSNQSGEFVWVRCIGGGVSNPM